MTTTEPEAAPGLSPQPIDEAEQRLERYLAIRRVPWTQYQVRRLWLRFVACQATRPHQATLFDAVQARLASIPASRQPLGRWALKVAFGGAACEWSAVVPKPYRCNEGRLLAGVLRDDTRAKIRAAVSGPRELALIECLWVLRRAETAALRWRDLDLARGMITVRKGKGNKPSWTLIPNSTREALTAWLAVAGAPPADAPVFPVPRGVGHPTRIGGPYTPSGLGKIVQAILTRAGCWERGSGVCHRFRRSFASQYLRQNRGDLVGVQRLMRHNEIATTSTYVFLEPEDLAPRMAALEL